MQIEANYQDQTKFLEIYFENYQTSKKFQLTKVDNKNFMLKSHDDHNSLYKYLDKWFEKYSLLNEKGYQNILNFRNGTLHMEDQLNGAALNICIYCHQPMWVTKQLNCCYAIS